MRIAALCDIHGNAPALAAVLREIARAGGDRIAVGGDVVAGPLPRETLALLRGVELPVDFVRGNADRELIDAMSERGASESAPEEARAVVEWGARQLDPQDLQWLTDWPMTLRLRRGAQEVLFCHATPRDDAEIFTRLTPEDRLLPVFSASGAPLVVCGHTHMQFDRAVGDVRVVNAGSVGMAYGATGAHWLIIDSDVRFMRTLYDFARAAERILATDYPQAEQFAANIASPHSEQAILDLFEPKALGGDAH